MIDIVLSSVQHLNRVLPRCSSRKHLIDSIREFSVRLKTILSSRRGQTRGAKNVHGHSSVRLCLFVIFFFFFFLYAVEYKICSRNRNIIQQALSHNTHKKQNKYMSR